MRTATIGFRFFTMGCRHCLLGVGLGLSFEFGAGVVRVVAGFRIFIAWHLESGAWKERVADKTNVEKLKGESVRHEVVEG